jgi:hypothetical protein
VGIGDDLQRHVVVFDCNIYLDAAHLLGAPFTWKKFDALTSELAKEPVPHPSGGAYDAVRALAACTSGVFAGDEILEVWSSAHIDKIVEGKAAQSTDPHPVTGYCGLGWSREDARALVGDLVHGLVDRSYGDVVDGQFPDGNPPLDHEDGMVYGTCRVLAGEDPLARVYCVTRDRGFLGAARRKELSGHTTVLAPATFVQLVRRARAHYSMRRMSG